MNHFAFVPKQIFDRNKIINFFSAIIDLQYFYARSSVAMAWPVSSKHNVLQLQSSAVSQYGDCVESKQFEYNLSCVSFDPRPPQIFTIGRPTIISGLVCSLCQW